MATGAVITSSCGIRSKENYHWETLAKSKENIDMRHTSYILAAKSELVARTFSHRKAART